MSDTSPVPESAPTSEDVVRPETSEPAAPLRTELSQPAPPLRLDAPAVPQPVAAGPGEVVLRIAAPWTISGFDSGIEGAPVITSAGTPVPASLAPQIVAAAERSGVTLSEE